MLKTNQKQKIIRQNLVVLNEKIKAKREVKQESGITLIVLVITIIVLLILAGVTIAALSGDNGILTKASEAKVSTEIAEVKERAKIDILGEQAGNNGELTKSKFIEILNKYFKNVPTEENFPEDFTDLTLETKEEYGNHNIKISEIYNGSFPKTIDSLKVGDKVYYDTENPNVGSQGVIECTVLYDKAYNEVNGTNYGIQIISSDVIKNADGTIEGVTLGFEDPTVTGSSNFEKGKNSYNNALKTLYDRAQEYLNTAYASGARCVGSDPADPDWDTTTNEAGYFTRTEGEDDYYEYMKNHYGTLKNEDTKYNTDWTQMGTMTTIKSASSYYWLASRTGNAHSSTTCFDVRSVMTSGSFFNATFLCLIMDNSTSNSNNATFGFRPVFTLKPEIKVTEGNGDTTPYTLAP